MQIEGKLCIFALKEELKRAGGVCWLRADICRILPPFPDQVRIRPIDIPSEGLFLRTQEESGRGSLGLGMVDDAGVLVPKQGSFSPRRAASC